MPRSESVHSCLSVSRNLAADPIVKWSSASSGRPEETPRWFNIRKPRPLWSLGSVGRKSVALGMGSSIGAVAARRRLAHVVHPIVLVQPTIQGPSPRSPNPSAVTAAGRRESGEAWKRGAPVDPSRMDRGVWRSQAGSGWRHGAINAAREHGSAEALEMRDAECADGPFAKHIKGVAGR